MDRWEIADLDEMLTEAESAIGRNDAETAIVLVRSVKDRIDAYLED